LTHKHKTRFPPNHS